MYAGQPVVLTYEQPRPLRFTFWGVDWVPIARKFVPGEVGQIFDEFRSSPITEMPLGSAFAVGFQRQLAGRKRLGRTRRQSGR
jgi:hypothetical protein